MLKKIFYRNYQTLVEYTILHPGKQSFFQFETRLAKYSNLIEFPMVNVQCAFCFDLRCTGVLKNDVIALDDALKPLPCLRMNERIRRNGKRLLIFVGYPPRMKGSQAGKCFKTAALVESARTRSENR